MDRLIPFLDFDNVRVFIRANFLFSPPRYRGNLLLGEQLRQTLVYRVFSIN